jgi:aminoglycoside 3-N-acetyltransferase
VIQALEETLGDEGTLVMPTHSGDLSDPSAWRNPPAPENWWETIRKEMPAYEPDLTPTRSMGAIAETFRKQKGTLRSLHPQVSFSARGKDAEKITLNHDLDYSLGEGSPLARVYDLAGYVLLLGVPHAKNTSLHLAEYRANYPWKKVVRNYAPILVGGKRRWVEFKDINGWALDFDAIGDEFDKKGSGIVRGSVGQSDTVRLMRQRALVDFGVDWMQRNRKKMPTVNSEANLNQMPPR